MVLVIATRFPCYSVTALPFHFYGKLFLHFIAVVYWGLGGDGEINDFKGNTVYRDFKTIMKQTKGQSAFYNHHEPRTLNKVSNKKYSSPPRQTSPPPHLSLTKHYYSGTTPF